MTLPTNTLTSKDGQVALLPCYWESLFKFLFYFINTSNVAANWSGVSLFKVQNSKSCLCAFPTFRAVGGGSSSTYPSGPGDLSDNTQRDRMDALK